jgi:hypothetical protein
MPILDACVPPLRKGTSLAAGRRGGNRLAVRLVIHVLGLLGNLLGGLVRMRSQSGARRARKRSCGGCRFHGLRIETEGTFSAPRPPPAKTKSPRPFARLIPARLEDSETLTKTRRSFVLRLPQPPPIVERKTLPGTTLAQG